MLRPIWIGIRQVYASTFSTFTFYIHFRCYIYIFLPECPLRHREDLPSRKISKRILEKYFRSRNLIFRFSRLERAIKSRNVKRAF